MDFSLIQLGAAAGGAYALIAVAANLTFRSVRAVNFAHGPMMLSTALLASSLAQTGPLARWPAFLAAPLAALISLAVHICVLALAETFIARPAQRARGVLGWVFATVGIGIVLQGAAGLIWGLGVSPQPSVILLPLARGMVGWGLSAIAILALLLALLLLCSTGWGRALRAVSTNPELAAAQGLPLPRLALQASIASAALAGLGGLLLAQISGPIDPDFGLQAMMLGFIAALLGGLGNLAGAIIAGVLVGLTNVLIGDALAPSAAHVLLLTVLVPVLIYRPRWLPGRIGINGP